MSTVADTTIDAPFEWDTNMYRLGSSVSGPTRLNLNDDAFDDLSQMPELLNSQIDFEDANGKPRPNWVTGQSYLIRVDWTPFWLIGR